MKSTPNVEELHGTELVAAIVARRRAAALAELAAVKARLASDPRLPELQVRADNFERECLADLHGMRGIHAEAARQFNVAGADRLQQIQAGAGRLLAWYAARRAEFDGLPGRIEALNLDTLHTEADILSGLETFGSALSQAWSQYRELAESLRAWEAENVA
jgi:hypothetical protein